MPGQRDKIEMAKWLILLVVLLNIGVTSVSGEITVNRTLPQSINAGSDIVVSLEIDVDESYLPSGIIIKEHPPPGWNITTSHPKGFVNPSGIKWMFYSDIKDRKINYSIKVPFKEVSGIYEFNGTAITLEREVEIIGNHQVEVLPRLKSKMSGKVVLLLGLFVILFFIKRLFIR